LAQLLFTPLYRLNQQITPLYIKVIKQMMNTIQTKEKTMTKRELENMFVKPLGSYQTINIVLLIKK
jgi:predicted glycosyltransferase involved in capsule biosynthesis